MSATTTPAVTSTPAKANPPTTGSSARRSASPRSWWSLALLHARYQILETVRVPIAVLGNLMFPALAMIFFIVPQHEVAANPLHATAATAQLATFAIASTCMFTFGVGVAEDRALPFDPFLRTLPAPVGPRLVGRLVNGVMWMVAALVPLVLIAAFLTEASITPSALLGALVAVPFAALPFLLLGIAIGYSLSAKAAIAVVQAALFPLAFAGGLFMPPEIFAPWLDNLSLATPTRAAREILVSVSTGRSIDTLPMAVLAGWVAVFAVLAARAYRRDEGRRFR